MLSKLVSIDNFFKNPQKIVDMAQTLDYERSEVHPGKRSINLFTSQDPQHVEFAKYFAKRIADEVFFGINKFMIDIRFHKNDIYDNDKANVGWIHNDPVSFAGIVYLNEEISDFNLGTSTFLKNKKERFDQYDFDERKEFNLTTNVTPEYLKILEENEKEFTETVRVGNVYNRLVAYDSKIWHRPNNFDTKSENERLTLLFFIDRYEYSQPESMLSLKSEYIDDI